MAHHSLRAREGYLSIDNRLGGPIPEWHLREIAALQATGVHVAVAQPGTLYESATATCVHCHAIVVLNPNRTRDRGYCAKCDGYTCDSPFCNRDCRSMARLIDQLQEHYFQLER